MGLSSKSSSGKDSRGCCGRRCNQELELGYRRGCREEKMVPERIRGFYHFKASYCLFPSICSETHPPGGLMGSGGRFYCEISGSIVVSVDLPGCIGI